MHFMLRLLATWLTLISVAPALASTSSLTLCNQTANQVYLALGYPLDQAGSQMAARGWYTLDAGSCKTVYDGPLTPRYFYIFGLDGASRKWVGDSSEPSFCMSQNAFNNLPSTDSCSATDQFRSRFLTIDSGPTIKAKHTFLLTAPRAGSIALVKAGTGLSANITPGSDEVGRDASIWMAAKYGDALFLRQGATDWVRYSGGKLPIAMQLSDFSAPATVSVYTSDPSAFPGLEFYVAYGVTEADLQKPGHLEKIYTAPPKPTFPLDGLTITCPAIVADLKDGVPGTGQCTATARYGATYKKLAGNEAGLVWTTSYWTYLAVDANGMLSANKTIGDYLDVKITASYTEGGITQTASATVSVQHNPIPGCTGKCACLAPKVLTGTTCALPQPTCVAPQILQNNVCVTPPPTCTAPQVLQNNVCVTPVTCKAPQVLQNNVCITPPTCVAPQVLQNNVCVTPTTCIAPQVLQNGICVAPAPTCVAPEVLDGGVCIKPPLKCTAPQVPDNGVCVTPTMTCPKFMVYHNGACNYPAEFDPRDFPTIGFRNMCNGWSYAPNGPCHNEEAYIRSAESCGMTGSNTIYGSSLLVYYRCLVNNSTGSFRQQYETQLYDYQKTYLICQPGYHVQDKHCVKDGPICTIVNGVCVYPTPTCTPPLVAQNGACVQPAVPVTNGNTGSTNGTGNSASVTIDSDGCYQSPSWALTVVKTSNSNGEFKVTYRNDSTYGIYLSFGNERADGTWDSGADHLGPGKSTTWWTAGGTGRYRASWVGSSKWESDWVCNDGRVPANTIKGP